MDVVLTGQNWNFVISRDSKPCIEPLDCCWLPPTVTLIQKQESNSLLDMLVYPKSSGLVLDGFCQFIEVAELCKDLRTIHLETGGFQIRMLSPPESANMLDSTKPLSPTDHKIPVLPCQNNIHYCGLHKCTKTSMQRQNSKLIYMSQYLV